MDFRMTSGEAPGLGLVGDGYDAEPLLTAGDVPGIGRVYKSLGTTRVAVAREREELLLGLAERGYLELVRAWLEDRMRLPALLEAHATGRLHELSARLRSPDVSLADAIAQCLRAKAADVRPFTLDRYRASLAHFLRFAGERATV